MYVLGIEYSYYVKYYINFMRSLLLIYFIDRKLSFRKIVVI